MSMKHYKRSKVQDLKRWFSHQMKGKKFVYWEDEDQEGRVSHRIRIFDHKPDVFIVKESERAVLLDRGISTGVILPGVYELDKLAKQPGTELFWISLKERKADFGFSGALTKEYIEVNISGYIRYRVVDPERFVQNVPDTARSFENSFEDWMMEGDSADHVSAVGVDSGARKPTRTFGALKRIVSQSSVEELISGGDDVIERCKKFVASDFKRWGVELLSITISSIDGKDYDKYLKGVLQKDMKSKIMQSHDELRTLEEDVAFERERRALLRQKGLSAEGKRLDIEVAEADMTIDELKFQSELKRERLKHQLEMEQIQAQAQAKRLELDGEAQVEAAKSQAVSARNTIEATKELLGATSWQQGPTYAYSPFAKPGAEYGYGGGYNPHQKGDPEAASSVGAPTQQAQSQPQAKPIPPNIQTKIDELEEKIARIDDMLASGKISEEKHTSMTQRLIEQLNRYKSQY